MNTAHLNRNPSKQPHPTVKGAHVYLIENIVGKRKELRTHREAVLLLPDGGWIQIQASRKTGQLGISAFYMDPKYVDTLNAMIAEQTDWLNGTQTKQEAA